MLFRSHITQKKGHGKTVYTLALLLDYPNSQDRERFKEAKARGEIPHNARIGGLIEIHGSGGRGYDWTEGCAALSDEDMKWLFHRVQVGTPVFIVGTDGVQNSISKTLQSLGP